MILLPPALLKLKFQGLPGLWLPIFLLWPLGLLLLIPLAILIPFSPGKSLGVAASLYALICALRGTQVDFRGARTRVLLSVH
jgi:hypothetical protein